MKRSKIAVVSLALTASLALASGCQSDDSTSSQGTPSSSESASQDGDSAASSADLPAVGTDFGKAPKWKFPSSDAPADLQVEVLKKGDGPKVSKGAVVEANYEGVVWGKDKAFDSSFERGATTAFSLNEVVQGWAQGIPGHTVGSRLLISVPPDLGYGSSGQPSAGIGGDDTIVFVVDIVNTFNADQAGEADAKVKTPASKLPVTVKGKLGQPTTITVPKSATAPKKPEVTVIAEGSGKPIAEGKTLVLAFSGTTWDGSSAIDTWAESEGQKAGPKTMPVQSGSVGELLEGVPVGSRVLVLLPQSSQGPAIAYAMDVIGQV